MPSELSPSGEALLTAALPKNWPTLTKAAVVQAVALARVLCVFVVAKAAEGEDGEDAPDAASSENVKPAEQVRLEVENALLREELALVRGRLARMPPENRPHYLRPERLRVLALMAGRGWNRTQAATALLVKPATISRWLRWAESDSPNVEHSPPVNKYPDEAAIVLHHLKALFPHFGKRRLAQMLARIGLHLSETTVGRKLKEPAPKPAEPEAPTSSDAVDASETTDASSTTGGPDKIRKPRKTGTTVVARYPGHVWGCDVTVVPIFLGFWVPWLPFSIAPGWPFCFHVVAVLDYFARKNMAIRAFGKNPSSQDITLLLDHAVARSGRAPKYVVTDKGSQFWSAVTKKAADAFQDWCNRHGVKPRFGAIGKHGSVALVERFWRSMKSEFTRRFMLPFGIDRMNVCLACYARWYDTWRPHQGIAGLTRNELYFGTPPACDGERLEIRKRYPLRDARAPPGSPDAVRAQLLGLRVTPLDGHRELPIVELVFDRVA